MADNSWYLLEDVVAKTVSFLLEEHDFEPEVVEKIVTWLGCYAVEYKGDLWIDQTQARHMLENWVLALNYEDPQMLLQPRGLKVDRMVDIQEFVESPDYMGQRGAVRAPIMEHLWNIFHGEGADSLIEIVLGGAIGIGKNYLADMGMAYTLYRLSCYHNPQIDFGLAPGSSIVFINQSEKLSLAKKVIFEQFAARLKQSPYFTKLFPFDPNYTSELRFPGNIVFMPVSGSTTAALGLNVYGGVLDEVNFMARVRDSKFAEYTGEAEYDQAEKLYTSLIRRMKSRFMDHGRVPGKLFIVSSANYPGDFIDRKIKEAAEEADGSRTIYIMTMAQWESIPKEKFSGETFLVEVGDDSRRSRILDSISDAVDLDSVIKVPIEYKTDFTRDIEAAIRDLAGLPVGGRNQFIRQRDLLVKAMELHTKTFGGQQLFVKDLVDLSTVQDVSKLINRSFLEQVESPTYAIHLDLSLTGDFCGIGVSRLAGYKMTAERREWDDDQQEFVLVPAGPIPIISTDGVLGVTPPTSDEVDLDKVGSLVLELAKIVKVGWVTADQFQSATLLQRFRKNGIRAGVLSVDAKVDPYMELKASIRDERLLLPEVSLLKQELVGLVYDPERRKIDHPPSGSKDLADGVAGSVFIIATRKASYRGPDFDKRNRRGKMRARKIRGVDTDQVEEGSLTARRRRRGLIRPKT